MTRREQELATHSGVGVNNTISTLITSLNNWQQARLLQSINMAFNVLRCWCSIARKTLIHLTNIFHSSILASTVMHFGWTHHLQQGGITRAIWNHPYYKRELQWFCALTTTDQPPWSCTIQLLFNNEITLVTGAAVPTWHIKIRILSYMANCHSHGTGLYLKRFCHCGQSICANCVIALIGNMSPILSLR